MKCKNKQCAPFRQTYTSDVTSILDSPLSVHSVWCMVLTTGSFIGGWNSVNMRIRFFVWVSWVNCKHWLCIYRHTEHRIRNEKKVHPIFFFFHEDWRPNTEEAEQKRVRLKGGERYFMHANWDKILLVYSCGLLFVIPSLKASSWPRLQTLGWMYSSRVHQCSRIYQIPNIHKCSISYRCFLNVFVFVSTLSNSVCVHNSVIKQPVPITDAIFYRSRHITQ